jgi:N6-L-threonylcarbamoyladenine synthase
MHFTSAPRFDGGALFVTCYNREMTANETIVRVLGIETSCDESAIAIVEAKLVDGEPVFSTVADALHSQSEIHAQFGGVFPALAKREHASNLPGLVASVCGPATPENPAAIISEETLAQALAFLSREPGLADAIQELLPRLARPQIDLISVTTGPGLEPALWVGINLARALSLIWNVPMVGANHMEGHVVSALAQAAGDIVSDVDAAISRNRFPFPAVALLISGGHTELIHARAWGQYEELGATRDDAVGEAFDKAARVLAMPYPGGPRISAAAALERERRANGNAAEYGITLPRPMISSGDLDFSFSGLKTAVLYAARDVREKNSLAPDAPLPDRFIEEVAYEFEEAAVAVLVSKTRKAIENTNARALIVGGGVIANTRIRQALQELADMLGIPLLLPTTYLATDNAVMIAMAGYLKSLRTNPVIAPELIADGNWSISNA